MDVTWLPYSMFDAQLYNFGGGEAGGMALTATALCRHSSVRIALHVPLRIILTTLLHETGIIIHVDAALAMQMTPPILRHQPFWVFSAPRWPHAKDKTPEQLACWDSSFYSTCTVTSLCISKMDSPPC